MTLVTRHLPLSMLVRQVAADPDQWAPYLQLPEQAGQRWWTRLSADSEMDVWLLSWLPGDATDLHDHGPSTAAFTVVRGELDEVRIAPDGRQFTVHRPRGSTTTLGPGVIHDVRGGGRGPAVSIHAYSPPLVQMNYYETVAESSGERRLRLRSSVQTREPESTP